MEVWKNGSMEVLKKKIPAEAGIFSFNTLRKDVILYLSEQ
jgi:hypothetical protein